MTRACGDCSLCCKVMYITELGKAADRWCSFCKPGRGGCTIYPDRPNSCVEFKCQWLLGHVEDFWKPLDSKMVLNAAKLTEDFSCWEIVVDTGFPNRWREPEYYGRIKQMALLGHKNKVLIRVQCGNQSWFVMFNKDIEIPQDAIGFDIIEHKIGTRDIRFKFTEEKTDDNSKPNNKSDGL